MSIIEILSLFRGAERLLIVGGGIVALYLGYRLFVAGFVGNQSGEFAGKSFFIKLIKVGPGVFFALFGTCVLVVMIWANLTMQISNKEGGLTTSYSYFGSAEESRIERIIEDIGVIKTLVADETASKENIRRALTTTQKALARTRLGEKIYEKCEHNPPEKLDNDCQIYKKMIK